MFITFNEKYFFLIVMIVMYFVLGKTSSDKAKIIFLGLIAYLLINTFGFIGLLVLFFIIL